MKKRGLQRKPFNFAALNMGMTDRYNWRLFFIRLIFPLTYAGFLTVQFFINFDTTFSGSQERYQIIKCRIQTNLPFALQKAKDNQPVKTKFRLNKRFQPAVIPALPDLSSAPVIHAITVLHLYYVNPFIPDPLHNIRLFRGPPIDA